MTARIADNIVKNKLLTLALTLVFALGVSAYAEEPDPPDPPEPIVPGTPDIAWYDAAGTAFAISTADELAGLAALAADLAHENCFGENDAQVKQTFTLQNDIDLATYENWLPVGSHERPFCGIFDGNGKIIRNLNISRSSSAGHSNDHAGLFGAARGGVIRNVGVTDANVAGGVGAVGGIVGFMSGGSSVTNVFFDGAVSGRGFATGGIAGQISGDDGGARNSTITNAYTIGRVSTISVSNNGAGGVVGVIEGLAGNAVSNCYSVAAVSAAVGGRAGGIAGYVLLGGVTNCAALNPSVSGDGRVVGATGGGGGGALP